MSNLDVIEHFYTEMLNEIFHSTADETSKELLIEALKNVRKTVTETVLSPRKG